MRANFPAFTGGEWSPKLHARTNLEGFGEACKTLENFVLMPYGGVNRRGGLEYLGACKNESNPTRLITFQFSLDTAFLIELSHRAARFWSEGELILSGGSPYSISTPYDGGELKDIDYHQIQDVIYITHPDHPVYKLTRVSNTNWTMAEVNWYWPPFRDIQGGTTKLTPSGKTGNITVTSNAAVFNSSHVGSYWMIGYYRTDSQLSLVLTTTGTGGSIRGGGTWSVTTFGTWGAGTLYLESTRNGTDWYTLRSFNSAASGSLNVVATGDAYFYNSYRLRYSGTGTAGAKAYLEMSDNFVPGIVKMTSFNSSTSMDGTVTSYIYDTSATEFWAEGSWSDYRGYPRSVCLHKLKLCFGGNEAEPLKLWSSAIDDFENFKVGVNDDDAMQLNMFSSERHTIQWMVSQQKNLVVGTSGNPFIVSAAEGDGVFTPSNFTVDQQQNNGADHIKAVFANDSLLYVERRARKIRDFVYTFERDKYVAPDLTLLSEHISSGGIKSIAFQQQPDPILWIVNGDGELGGLTLETDYGVRGWHRHTTDGYFEDVNVIKGQDYDEVYLVVRRTINGSTRRYIERLDPEYRDVLETEDKDGWFYVDSGKYVNNGATPSASVTVAHLVGKTVDALCDGNVVQGLTVGDGGAVTLPIAAYKVSIGLPYESILRPIGLEIGIRDGSSQGRRFRVSEMSVRIYKSLGGEIETAPDEWDQIHSRSTSDVMDSSPPVFTGYKHVDLAGDFTDTAEIGIRQSQPLPLTVLALIPKVNVYGE